MGPVCGYDNITYNNACLCRRAGIRIRSYTRCVTTTSTVITGGGYNNCNSYRPVCGYNNRIYNNACLCRRANVRILYNKRCSTSLNTTYGVSTGIGYGLGYSNYGNYGGYGSYGGYGRGCYGGNSGCYGDNYLVGSSY